MGKRLAPLDWDREAESKPAFLRAEVVGAAGHVGQRTDKVVAALKGWIQQHGAHLLHLLPRQHTIPSQFLSIP